MQAMTPTDADLVLRVLKADDRHAFSTLVRRHQSAVRGLLRRLTCGDEALADDLAQETFLRAYRGLRGYRGGARISTWLHRIAFNVFLSSTRKATPTAHEESDIPTRPRERSLMRHDLDQALGELAPAERAAISLAYAKEHTHTEVAAILNCPLGTAKTLIARAKEKLRRRLRAWEPSEAT